MKINWKILLALVVIVGVIYWAVDSVLPRSYTGTDLDFNIGRGPVTVTNPSTEPIPAQLVSIGRTSFRVSSTIDDVSGSSTREGSGASATHLVEFELPPGVSEFTITRGTDVSFVANTETELEATVQPANASGSRITIVMAAVVVLAALFYISHTTSHRWISILRRQEISVPDLKPEGVGAAGGQGAAIRPYGDNRTEL